MTQILEYLWAQVSVLVVIKFARCVCNSDLAYLSEQPAYRETMVGFAKDAARFVRFVNMLINDSIYAFDEALTRLISIRNTQARAHLMKCGLPMRQVTHVPSPHSAIWPTRRCGARSRRARSSSGSATTVRTRAPRATSCSSPTRCLKDERRQVYSHRIG